VTSFAIGDTYYLVKVAGAASLPFPSPGDAAFLLFYPFMLAALAVAVRHHVRGLAWSVWLDCTVGSLGAASVLAVLLSPVLGSALTGSLSLANVVAVAYPMSDLLLVAAVAGIASLRGTRMGSRLVLLIVGLMVFARSGRGLRLAGDREHLRGGNTAEGWMGDRARPDSDVGRRR
jgi:diguanylate cyclase